MNSPLLFLAVALTFSVVLVNGCTDAPNAIATCVSTRCLSERTAVCMAAICNFLGLVTISRISNRVAVTVTTMVQFKGASGQTVITVLCGAMVSVVAWAILAWAFGIPTSESHALIAGLTGGAVAWGGSEAILWSQWLKVVYGLGISLLPVLLLGYGFCKGVEKIFKKADPRKAEPFFRRAQIGGAAATAFLHGAQDGQKFTGILLLCTFTLREGRLQNHFEIPLWLTLVCSVVLAAGTAVGGKKIIHSLGEELVKLEKQQGFAADLTSAVTLGFCSALGLPVSTTHVKVAAMTGAGAAARGSAVNFRLVGRMVWAWALTFPGCAALSYCVTKLFLRTFT